jgi:hypothetical protein
MPTQDMFLLNNLFRWMKLLGDYLFMSSSGFVWKVNKTLHVENLNSPAIFTVP